MRSMQELMLVQETALRACAHLQSMLILVQLSFDEGEAVARQFAELDKRIIDPQASAHYDEARKLLLQPAPDLPMAMMALFLAAVLEPDCYGLTDAMIRGLVIQAARETRAAELAAAEQDLYPETELQNRT